MTALPSLGSLARVGARVGAWIVLGATPCALLGTSAAAQTRAISGEWGASYHLPLIGVHAAVLPTGKVLYFAGRRDPLNEPIIDGYLFDPADGSLTNVRPPDPWNPMCAGHNWLSDGQLVVVGGTGTYTPLTGSKLAYRFSPWTQEWTPIAEMSKGRWYATLVSLPGDQLLAFAGLSENEGLQNTRIELWDRQTDAWTQIGERHLPYYPHMHLLPSGKIFMAGPSFQTELFDPSNGAWTTVAFTNTTWRLEASSVLLPGTQQTVLLMGGYDGLGQPTESVEIIDLAAAKPEWTATTSMNIPRMEHCAVLLPDGKVMVVGGRSDYDLSPTAVLKPEIFDPATSTWTLMAPSSFPRRYHSTSVLLPDARVACAGSDEVFTGEIFSPPYLFQGPRPEIHSAPATVGYGESFTIDFAGPTSTHKAVLMELPVMTHSNNMSQRYIPLGTIGASGSATLVAPAGPTLAPAGFYMLFVVSSEGVPSVAEIVRVVAQTTNGAAFCFGDGSATACPCDNASAPGTNSGCVHSLGRGGQLFASGTASTSDDSLVLSAIHLPQSTLFYLQGTEMENHGVGLPMGDGLRCLAGTIVRLGIKHGAFSQYPEPTDNPISLEGQVGAAQTRTYQVWYRNPTDWCTPDTFNFTNAWEITWAP